MSYVVCGGGICHMRAAFIYEQSSERITGKKSDLWLALTVFRSRLFAQGQAFLHAERK
jgi:hypothetical protein